MATQPTLAMIPSGYKDGKLYSVLPTDGVGDFDVTRGSNATRINKDGLIETVTGNTPRLNYPLIDGVVSGCPSLLLEPQSINLLTYSQDLSNSVWAKQSAGTGVNPITTANYATAPDGSTTATRVVFDKGTGTTSGDFSQLNDSETVTTGATTSKSIYLKSNTNDDFVIVLYGSTNATGTNVEKITVTNEWQRFSVYGTVPATTSGISLGLREINVSGLSNNADILVWGAQLEELPYPTSYIPTQGGVVTRLADSCSQTVPGGVIGQTEGTIYSDVNFVGVTQSITNQIFFVREQGNNNGYLFAGFYQGKLNVGLKVGGSTKFDTFFSGALSKGRYKIAISYSSGNTKVFINGSKVGSTMTQTFGVNNFAQIYNGNDSLGTNQLGDINRDFRIYNTVLTDAELATLTTI